MIRRLVFAALLAMAGSATAAPSFNCAKATTPVEKAICANPALADQDGAPWVLTLTRRGAVLVVRQTPPAGVKNDGFGPPFCGMNGSLSGDWFAVR